MAIGDKIKLARKKTGLSQEEFAKLCGVSQSAFAFWESGKRNPKYEQLNKIAKISNIPIDEFIKNEEFDRTTEFTDIQYQITYLEMINEFLDMPNIKKNNLIPEDRLKLYKESIKEMIYKCRNSTKTSLEEKIAILDGFTKELTRDLLITLSEHEATMVDLTNIFYLIMYYFSLDYDARDILVGRAEELTMIKMYQPEKNKS